MNRNELFLSYINKLSIKNKSPLFWLGSKTALIEDIIKIIPEHKIYVEPFAGGATIFFYKNLVELNVLNDIDYNLTNFYMQAKLNGDELIKYIEAIPYNIDLLKKFYYDLVNEKIKDDLIRAVIFFAVINTRFNHAGYTNVVTASVYNKKFIEEGIDNRDYVGCYLQKIDLLKNAIDKLRRAEIYNEDGIDIIKKFDGKETLFYLDPPYINGKQRYNSKKFRIEDMKNLIEILKNIKGKFILNCYLEDLNGCDISVFNISIKETIKGNGANNRSKIYKNEAILTNYDCEYKLF